MSEKWKDYAKPENWHPAASVFALMDEESEDFKNLADDIKTQGLNNPITLYEDKILDGRNRIRACIVAGVEPEFNEWKPKIGQTPESWSSSQNIHRRHLTRDQKIVGENDLRLRSYTILANLRKEYADFEEDFSKGMEEVRAGRKSISSHIRHMDWIKNGRKVEEKPYTVFQAAVALLKFLSYEGVAVLYEKRKNRVQNKNFQEAWNLVRTEIFGISSDLQN